MKLIHGARNLGALLAILATLVAPQAAFAAGTSSQASDNLTVLSTYTLTGVPSDLTYNSVPANFTGATWLDPTAPGTGADPARPDIGLVHIVKFGGSDGSVRLSLNMSDLTGARQSIGKTNRIFYTAALSPGEQVTACSTWNDYNAAGGSPSSFQHYDPNTNAGKTLAVTNHATNCAAINVGLGIDVPAGITGDVFHGTVEFVVGG